MSLQLPLNIQLRDDATFESFYPGQNLQAMEAVKQLSLLKGENFIYLFGASGSGRSHLLQAACQNATENRIRAVYLPLHLLKFDSRLFQGLETLPLICIDNLDRVAAEPEWEEPLFHLFNRIKHSEKYLLVAANVSPALLPMRLPDLKSRLISGVTYQLHPLEDEEKLWALEKHAAARGLVLSQTLGQFLLSRASRSLPELIEMLDKLDHASLATQRRLTIPFVKQVLGL